jgi:hypothetical protein
METEYFMLGGALDEQLSIVSLSTLSDRFDL